MGENKMSVKLKPCPFCGKPALVHKEVHTYEGGQRVRGGNTLWKIECGNCWLEPILGKDSYSKAAEWWNHRGNENK